MKFTKYIFALLIIGLASQLPLASKANAAQSPVGKMVSDNGTVYMILETVKRPFTSAGAFSSYVFNYWEDVSIASPEDIALTTGDFIPPRDGSVICSDRGTDKGTCYLITDGKKAGFESAEIFKQLGFAFDKALTGDVSFLTSTVNISSGTETHKVGTVIIKDGSYYLIGKNGLIAMPTTAILNSWGYKTTHAVKANAEDLKLANKFAAEERQANELKPFEPVTPAQLVLDNEDKLSIPFEGPEFPEITESWLYSNAERAIHGYANHGGVDWAAPRGTPVYAAADGYAISSTHISPLARTYQGKTVGFGLGEFVQIWHPKQGVFTSYSHLSKVDSGIPYFKPTCNGGACDPEVVYNDGKFSEDEGEFIKRGDLVGYVGDSGLSWGYEEKPRGKRVSQNSYPSWDETHLHFETYTRAAPNFGKSRRYDPFGIYGRLGQYNNSSYTLSGSLWKIDTNGSAEFAK